MKADLITNTLSLASATMQQKQKVTLIARHGAWLRAGREEKRKSKQGSPDN
jgi:hypothetical protein